MKMKNILSAFIALIPALAFGQISGGSGNNGGVSPPGNGSVKSVSVVTANGVSGTVATATTTPAITISLGAITPNSVTIGSGTGLAEFTTGLLAPISVVGSGNALTALNSVTSAATQNFTISTGTFGPAVVFTSATGVANFNASIAVTGSINIGTGTILSMPSAATLQVSGSSPGAIALRYIQGAGSATLNGNLIDLGATANANLNLSTSGQTGDITFTTGSTPTTALTLSHTSQAATFGGTIATAAPSGGTAAAWNLGSFVSTPPTGTSGYLQTAVAGTAYSVPVGPVSLVRTTGRVTAQTAAAASIATYTVGASDGTFLVSGNVLVTASVTNSFIETCAYTDESNTARTLTLTFSNVGGTFLTTITNVTGTGAYEGIPLHIRAKAGTTITFATVGTFTSVTYNAEGEVRQIN